MQLQYELENDTKWVKCEIKSINEIKLTEKEREMIANMKDVKFECHSELCDSGGRCDLYEKTMMNFCMEMEEDFNRFEIRNKHESLLKEIPSLDNFIARELNNKLVIYGTAEKRQLELWLKNKGYPLIRIMNMIPFEIIVGNPYKCDSGIIEQYIPSAHNISLKNGKIGQTIITGLCDEIEYKNWRKSLLFTKKYDIPYDSSTIEEFSKQMNNIEEGATWSSDEDGNIVLSGYFIPQI